MFVALNHIIMVLVLFCSAALYVMKVLRGVVSEQDSAKAPSTPAEVNYHLK